MRNRKLLFVVFLITGLYTHINAQDDLLGILDQEQPNIVDYTSATFKMTRISYGHSIETRKKGILEIFVANRFWNIPDSKAQSFAADRLAARIALEYGVTDRFSMGFGGSNFDGLFDGYLKYKLVRQRKGGSPFSITLLQGGSYNSNAFPDATIQDDFSNRLSFTTQALIARKISSNFSLQVAPSFIHKGMVPSPIDPKNVFAVGFGGRYKLGGHVSVVSEYYYVTNPLESVDTYGPFSLGVNWEVGDLMLQFMLTNTRNMVEDTFIVQTPNNFNFRDPNLNFGFNATYVLHLKRKK
ncbi:hypothetical protein GGR42_000613 [Saonia flava]|uniref:DUF5777 domain-containing protein n=1 Tax=Saonia flava TaxID=523696 RepID=A0A846QPY8_9FLAO|nr:DUF5777 family beta-barrel protein [Saonia flava]NJB70151.1 hypothetical protein [Saonia flava]